MSTSFERYSINHCLILQKNVAIYCRYHVACKEMMMLQPAEGAASADRLSASPFCCCEENFLTGVLMNIILAIRNCIGFNGSSDRRNSQNKNDNNNNKRCQRTDGSSGGITRRGHLSSMTSEVECYRWMQTRPQQNRPGKSTNTVQHFLQRVSCSASSRNVYEITGSR